MIKLQAKTTGGEFADINAIPLVMTERVEILTDGGSALYGADAVAGVVNVIMRTEFEGLEIYGDIQGVVAAYCIKKLQFAPRLASQMDRELGAMRIQNENLS